MRLDNVLSRPWKGHGVQTHLARDPHAATGTTVALGLADGHRHFLSCLPNNETLCFEDLDLGALDGCAHLLRADVWFSRLDARRWELCACSARPVRRGIATSLDLNFDPCWSSGNKAEIAQAKTASA